MKYTADENPDEISIIWSTEDVLCVRPDLTKDQAREVLYNIYHSYDATIGINWEVIDIIAEEMFGKPKEN